MFGQANKRQKYEFLLTAEDLRPSSRDPLFDRV